MGLATTFYNDRDMDLGLPLTKVLLENSQDLPDFLEEYKPVGELIFEEDDDGGADVADLDDGF